MKYKITYSELSVVNKTKFVEAENMNRALVIFAMENPNANYEKIEVIENGESISISK